MTHDPHAVVAALVRVAREEILTVFSPESCVASTRIGIDALQYFGVPAKPIPVSAMVLNADARAILESDGLMAVAAAVHAREPEDQGGPWTIGLGVRAANFEDGAGHVAIAIPTQRMLVDLSLDQANRENKHIFLAPAAFEIPTEIDFLNIVGERMLYTVTMAEGTHPVTIMYEHESSHRYRLSDNWRRKGALNAGEGFRAVTAAIITRMKQELDATR